MTSHPEQTLALRMLSTLLCATTLIACGGGGSGPENTAGAPGAMTAGVIVSGTSDVAPVFLTDVRFENTNLQAAQSNVPVTFGQVFAVGAMLPTNGLVGRLEDGSTLPLQADIKARHPDGSVRHAIISAVLPSLAAGQVRTVGLLKTGTAPATQAMSPDFLLDQGFNSSVHLTINGVQYNAFADDLLKDGPPPKTWLAGSVANEWHVWAPLRTYAGVEHPHLTARFAIRWYDSIKKARVDVTIENNWAYEAAPQNFTYDAKVLVAAKPVYTKAALVHRHHARWRKVFWWGGDAPQVNVKHNTAYLIASRAVPNYDPTITVPESTLAAMKTRWTGAITEPMAVGLAATYMPGTGGRDDIGLLPAWASMYLLSMDQRAKEATLGTADLAGSWSSHYRDKKTDRPVSLMNYPYMTLLGTPGDTYNPVTKVQEYFPKCGGDCSNPNFHDNSHQPGFAYLPYLTTGDYYYLEELQFWGMWNLFSSNPGYRQNIKGLLIPEQVRGQAWGLRTLSEVAYITPDSDPLKSDFLTLLNNNLDWYNATYTNNPDANKLGVVTNGYAVVYNNNTGLAPWQDDFFTQAVGHTAELGFEKAKSLLEWKTKFPVNRMIAPGTCWIDGAIYAMTIRDTATSPIYATMGEAYKASHTAEFNALGCNSPEMAASLGLKVGQMTGYSDGSMGYPSNMQPALAYGADVGGVDGKSAWAVFMARSVKPDYSSAPQFAIVPR